MNWNAKYALLLLFSTMVTWICGIIINKIGKKEILCGRESSLSKNYRKLKKLAVIVNCILTLSVLFIYKYFDFAVNSLNIILSKLHFELITPQFDVILPVVISFYTFQALSYSIDVYRGDIKV